MEFTNQLYSDVHWDPLHTGNIFTNIADNSSHYNSGGSHDHPVDPVDNVDSLRLVPEDVLKIEVSDPQRHGEGNGSFVTYLVTTKVLCLIYTVLDSFRVPEMSLRRRFQDFDWLHKSLLDEIPVCILPPLPDKHRIGKIKRFNPTSLTHCL
ncbi:Sorting nexin-7, partial [Nowakowskiella sp. JEL0078]